MAQLTKQQAKQYVKSGGNNCPHCGSSEISGGDFEADYNQAWRSVECEGCGKVWTDIYTLTDVEGED